MNSPPLALRVRGLSVTFAMDGGPVDAVRHVDLDVPRGQLVALLGESGSGKSVTARAVMGLAGAGATVSADSLMLGDTDLRTVPPGRLRELRGTRMSLVLQDALSALNPVLTIGDQLGELFRVHDGASKRAARAKAVDLLGMVGIPAPSKRVGDYPHQFSGGMRQRILIAMAIALEPELLIADEPTTALDVTVQAQILDLLGSLRAQLDMGVLLITHDLAVVGEVADHLAVMYAGRVVEAGDADTVLGRPGHPYTEALLRSVPRLEDQGSDLFTIPGAPPNPARVPSGCPFHPRCHRVVEPCPTVMPDLVEIAGRSVACHQSEAMLAPRAPVGGKAR
ncbi:peptide/nickel transport system ATP-binding protein/oligopeptide transport system ATP-binding protein [Actinophytocola oryzae]|uniref:Peptide/nickel transport system ATP-binding protein/oligopeptide transport system ATP-binding protein n=1 Tax=Actinophytocola oryzae TaxID=502181 RepID=A0A4R7VY45_9PSEU|nr:ABC transporter ATP-binding protein [Actinophytocola oryzae]TDV54984.1 peptide/nickel transport system ATP-binding protein/oligopeptide transport system ATP-binding protein [Actinophytocola oryzae]